MRSNHPAKTLAWMGTGAVLVAAGFLLSPPPRRRRRDPEALPDWDQPDGLADRPVAAQALSEGLAAAQRVEQLSGVVDRMETRLERLERGSSAERVDAVWQKIAHIEEQIAQLRAERLQAPPIDALPAQVEEWLSPRLASLEARLDEHAIAISELQKQAARTEANLQRMIAAVEKLADQVSLTLPPGPRSVETQNGTAAPKPASPGTPAAASFYGMVPLESYTASLKPAPHRWKSFLTLAAAIVSLVCWAVPPFPGVPAAAGVTTAVRSDLAVAGSLLAGSISSIAAIRQPDDHLKISIQRLCGRRGNLDQAGLYAFAFQAGSGPAPRADAAEPQTR
jgi:hypothetical protein